MVKIRKTYIFCLDNHRSFSDDVIKRFSDTARYKVLTTSSQSELLQMIGSRNEKNGCSVAIIGMHDSKENIAAIENLTIELKKRNPDAGILLLVKPDKTDEVLKGIRFNIDSYIPKNDNSILRIHNTVKKIISHRNLSINRRRRKLSFLILLAFLILSVLIIIISYFRLPEFF